MVFKKIYTSRIFKKWNKKVCFKYKWSLNWLYRNPLLNLLKPTAGKRAKVGRHHYFAGGKSCVLIVPPKKLSLNKYCHFKHSQRSWVWRKWIVARHLHKELWGFESLHWRICQKWSHISTSQTGNPSGVSILIVVYFDPADTCFVIFSTFGKGDLIRLH